MAVSGRIFSRKDAKQQGKQKKNATTMTVGELSFLRGEIVTKTQVFLYRLCDLYVQLAAVCASRFNPVLADFYQRRTRRYGQRSQLSRSPRAHMSRQLRSRQVFEVGNNMKTILTLIIVFMGVMPVLADEGPTRVDADPLKLVVRISRTAHLFYVVDQLSTWSYYCHPEYARNMRPLTQSEADLLAKHRTIRKNHPWGDDLEKVFYTDTAIDTALSRGVEAGRLTPTEAETEKAILEGLSVRVDELLNRQRPLLDGFIEHLQGDVPRISAIAKTLQRFTGVSPEPIPVFLFATPSTVNFGGGYNGGVLTLEIPTRADAYPVFLHELFHAFLKPRKRDIERAVQGVPGLDAQTLEEGIAHALAPGLVWARADSPDPLLSDVQRGIEENKRFSDPSTCYYRFALALRPILRQALDDDKQTLTTFLPRAIDVWNATVALNQVIDQQNQALPPTSTSVAGPVAQAPRQP